MKLKKYSYLILIVLMLLVGINKVDAATSKKCYYMSNDNTFKATLTITTGRGNLSCCTGSNWYYKIWGGCSCTLEDYARVSVDKIGESKFDFNKEVVANWWDSGLFSNWYDQCTKGNKVCFSPYYESEDKANSASNPACPSYLVFQYCEMYYVWATEDEATAKRAVEGIEASGCSGNYGSSTKTTAGGKEIPITSEEYYSEFEFEGIIEFDKDHKPTCADYDAIFGDKNNPDSISYMVHEVLQYVRIIVPILIILLGTIDFAKAVIAGKEDNMKKAQNDFIKRVIIGVAIFFVPLLVDVLMKLADIVWEGNYTHCNL